MRRFWRALAILSVVAASSGCAWFSGEPELSPQEVVTQFYRWYLGYPGNPLVDREYRRSPYLADSYVRRIDEIVAGDFHADPILLAQDIPQSFSVDETTSSGDEAAVTLSLFWSGNPDPSRRRVDLEIIDGEWKITGVSMVEP